MGRCYLAVCLFCAHRLGAGLAVGAFRRGEDDEPARSSETRDCEVLRPHVKGLLPNCAVRRIAGVRSHEGSGCRVWSQLTRRSNLACRNLGSRSLDSPSRREISQRYGLDRGHTPTGEPTLKALLAAHNALHACIRKRRSFWSALEVLREEMPRSTPLWLTPY